MKLIWHFNVFYFYYYFFQLLKIKDILLNSDTFYYPLKPWYMCAK